MGRIKIDTNKSNVKHDTIYPYIESGVDRLLRDIHKLHSDECAGDTNAICMRVDLERALQSDALTPRQRAAISLYYFCQLTQQECAKVLGITKRNVGKRLENALSNIARHMQGECIPKSQAVNESDRVLDKGFWLGACMNSWLRGIYHWWCIVDLALDDINCVVGMPKREEEQLQPQESEYPYYTEAQMQRRFANEIPRPEIYPVFDNSGVILDESGELNVVLNKERYT